MTSTLDAVLASWPYEPWVVACLAVTGAVYLRGWLILRRRNAQQWTGWHLASFLVGLLAIFVAIASPIEPFSALLMQVHMVQHLLLMMVAPPLIWLSEPAIPLLRGLPAAFQRDGVGPFLRSKAVRGGFRFLTFPVTAWVVYVGVTWVWHAPIFFDAALRSPWIHKLEHACFLGAGLLFWWPIVLPRPARPRWSRWLIVPYLFFANVQNTALSAVLAFSDYVLYPHYSELPRLDASTALNDQAAAGALMWVPGSMMYLIPLGWVGFHILYGRPSGGQRDSVVLKRRVPKRLYAGVAVDVPATVEAAPSSAGVGRTSLPLVGELGRSGSSSQPDMLRVPLLGRFLRWRHARRAMQIPMFGLAVILIVDGWLGPQVSPLNLAGVLPWIHWRGILVLGLLLVGNMFCAACPLVLPRSLTRRWWSPRWKWPKGLQNKWLAVGLLVIFFWSYEVFALWDSPWWTAWILVGYFVTAFAVDSLFQGASFCKYLCPIGQFNFVQSLASPTEVRVRDEQVCRRCTTYECIRGDDKSPGCELKLFLPSKSSNMDCTLCLDCIHTCPHDNIAIQPVRPASELWRDVPRSGVGRFVRRTDLAVLVLTLVFAAFVNAAGMVAPVVAWQDWLAVETGLSMRWVITLSFVMGLVVFPGLLIGGTTFASHSWSRTRSGQLSVMRRYSYALVPLGASVWLAHYSFHFFGSIDAMFPALQRAAGDVGLSLPGSWDVSCCCQSPPSWILPMEILFLDIGMLASLYVGYRIALEQHGRTAAAVRAFVPWGLLIVLLFVAGLWLVFQPMQMRGTMMMSV